VNNRYVVLYVPGCATIPTPGKITPTLTIMALALRFAQHFEAGLGGWYI
jgi:choline dehydrogenase-like flavoprotein